MNPPTDWRCWAADPVSALMVSILRDLKDALRETMPWSDSEEIAAEIMFDAVERLEEEGAIQPIPEDTADILSQENWCKESEERITLRIREILTGG